MVRTKQTAQLQILRFKSVVGKIKEKEEEKRKNKNGKENI